MIVHVTPHTERTTTLLDRLHVSLRPPIGDDTPPTPAAPALPATVVRLSNARTA